MSTRVLIWEPDELQGAYLLEIYAQAGYRATCVTGYQALRNALQAYRKQPLLLVLGHFERPQQLKSLLQWAPLASLLVLKRTGDGHPFEALLELGADACLSLPVRAPELLAQSAALMRHTQRVLKQAVRPQQGRPPLQRGPLQLDLDRQSVRVADQDLSLSPQAFALLHYFALNANQPLSREQIYQTLWPDENPTRSRRLDNLVLILRKQLPPHPELVIETCYGVGYRCLLKA
ncbi:MAG: winged helix-turn-helix transcriptional regulator [Candidatus Sericytochromatia bacterium]